ncbi:ABC transporter substrate-binding protein [Actinoallomurus rhizosphaericola]|uniref:ABC transporter substrate-binding protein n=1 Tax=Actinoallomurus rhizosphaericola TaxID=2952536 RepID=UPI0020921AA3|nr:ABC transporter substrate-binding protein [Actinoallomurus rhizosphaericola]MCO5995997.1 ABC transporter substrate-binding protein [Actinoallomurus rhizosphaericola]
MKLRSLVLALVPIVAVAAACGGGGDKTTGASGKKLDKVTLTLNWYPYGEHAPFYYGKKQGIFEKHGIDLQIKAGQGSQKTVQATGAGQTDFGWADTPALLAGVSQGLPVKSIGVYLQTTPAAVQFFSDKAIKTPADLKGKRIAATAGDAPSRTFPAFLKKNGLTDSDVHLQNTDPAGKMAAVISGRTDGLIGYANDQGPTMAAKAGKQVAYLKFADFGLNFYSNGLLVGDRKLKSDTDLVKRMSAATSEAWAEAEKDSANAVAAMRGASQQLPSETVLADQFKTTLSLLHTAATQGKAPGVNTDADWRQTIAVFTQSGLISKAQAPSAYWDPSAAPQG